MKNPSEIYDYHERLGLKKDCSKDEIKKAYREKAMMYHPDKNPGKEEKSRLEFIAVSEAYENLIDKPIVMKEKDFSYYENIFFYNFPKMAEMMDEFVKSKNPAVKKVGTIMGAFFRGKI